MEEDYGLFIGMTNVPVYSNNEFNPEVFEKHIISETFSSFRKSLNASLLNDEVLDEVLYSPINFYAFGSFNLISLSFIDDFHFGNFSFRPYNKHIKPEFQELSNFQYQVVNNFNLKFCDGYKIKDLKESRFIGISKIKINSALLIGDTGSFIKKVKEFLLNTIQKEVDFKVILGESFSWHELTFIFYGNTLEGMLCKVNSLRSLTVEDLNFEPSSENLLYTIDPKAKGINIFTDTETIYGKNAEFFNKSSKYFDKFCKEQDTNKTDKKLSITTKLHVKTGHSDGLFKFLRKNKFDNVIKKDFVLTNGRSDHSMKYDKHSLISYLKFWRELHFNKEEMSGFFQNVRKIHTNLAVDYDPKAPKDLNTSFYTKLFQNLKFKPDNILDLEKDMQSLKIPKEVANKVLVLFTNFNDIICDVNLYIYFIDLKSILEDLKNTVKVFSEGENIKTNQLTPIRKVKGVTDILLEYVEVFQNAYQNRYLDSKKLGYNLDIKGDFNGGVHQIISAFDSIHKIVSKEIRMTSKESTFLPVASYGSFLNDIKSSRINLHLNYFQLFQPETFLFSIVKENINFMLDKSFLSHQKVDSDFLIDFEVLILRYQGKIAKKIHSYPDIKSRFIIYNYLPPALLRDKLLYIYNYTLFVNVIWEQNIDVFIFWYWNSFIQNPVNYNIDGTLRIDLLKEHFLAFYIALESTQGTGFVLDEKSLRKYIQSEDVLYYLFDPKSDVFSEVKFVFEFICNNIPEFFNMLTEIQHLGGAFFSVDEDLNYHKINNIIISYLKEFKDLLYEEGKNSTFARKQKTGKAINGLKNYCKGVFDPHGGLFIIDKKLRVDFLKKRLKIINELREIGYEYKKDFYIN